MFRGILFVLLFSIISLSAQESASLPLKNGIDKPNSTTTHHFGLFHLRINQNFKEKPVKKTTLQFSIESGNSFHPFVEMYLPEDLAIREQFSNTIWHNRNFQFIDQQTTPAEYSNINIDAIFKVFRFDLQTRISEKHELEITLRTFIPTEGHYPLSPFTSDETIEWFHSNIAGGEDTFGRRFFGLNKVIVEYTDRNNRTLSLKKNQFIFAGIEFNHFYYPTLFESSKNIFVNFGSHLGINTTKHNPSFDLGASANIHKKWILKNYNEFRFGFGISGVRKKAITYGNSIDFGNNPWLASGELNLEFTKHTKKGNYHSFSINYQLQTQYNKSKEEDYYFLDGGTTWQDINQGWHNGFTTLYDTLSAYTFFYTYGRKKFAISLYLQEDLKVNNAPDLQTGISIKIPIVK